MANDSGTPVVSFPFMNQAQVITLGSILPLMCINVVALRFFTRLQRKVGLGPDDWLILPGLVLYIGMCICMLIGATNNVMGFDSFKTDTNPGNLQSYLIPQNQLFAKLLFAFQLMLTIAYGFVKCSILAMYRRIFVTHRNSAFDIICKITMAIVIAWSATFFIMTVATCGNSPSAFWGTAPEKSMSCQRSFAAGQGLASSDLILDVILMLLPQPLVWKLQLSVWKKVMVSGIIALGCSCIGASIARIVLFTQIDRASDLSIPLDQNQIVTLSMYYSALDGGLAVIAACLPTLRPLFKGMSVQSIVRGVRSSFGSTSAGSRGSKAWRMSKQSDSEAGKASDVEKGQHIAYVGAREVTIPLMRDSGMPSPPIKAHH